MGTDIVYYFHIIAWESCYTLHRFNIRSHQRHINTSSQQSDEAGTWYPRLTEKELEQTFTSLSNTAQENGCRAHTKPCRTGYCFKTWPTTLYLPCRPTYLKLLPESEKWGEWKEITEREGCGGLHLIKNTIFCSVSGSADYFKLDICRVSASQFNFKNYFYLSLQLVAHISLESMSHSLYSNCTVSSSLRMKSMLIK